MKRGALVALLALLAVLVVSGTTVAATAGSGAGAPAFAKKGKKKGCKKKGKKKKGCKGKGKPTGKAPQGGSKGQGTQTPGAGAVAPPAAPVATWPPVDGVYVDTAANGFTLKLSSNVSSATMQLSAFGTVCVLNYISTAQPAAVTSTSLTAGGEEKFTSVGSAFTVKWSLSLSSDLSYVLTVDSKNEGGPVPPCDKPGAVFKGTLAKIG